MLKNECVISAPFNPATATSYPEPNTFKALWDTGATHTVITQAVVDRCGLIPTGMTHVSGVHGTAMVETYLANIMLPNSVGFHSLRVTKGIFGQVDFDILIGMDIIAQGDFTISHPDGKTQFSFSHPSAFDLDLVKLAHDAKAEKSTKNPSRKKGSPRRRKKANR